MKLQSMSSRTTISVDKETRNELYYRKRPEESYEEYIRRVCGLESDDGAEENTHD